MAPNAPGIPGAFSVRRRTSLNATDHPEHVDQTAAQPTAEPGNHLSRRSALRHGGAVAAAIGVAGMSAGLRAVPSAAQTFPPAGTPTADAGVAAPEDADPAFLSGPVIPPSGRFRDTVVLITGATSGIGRRTAERFAAEGASVFFCGRREALGAEVEAGIRQVGGEATYLRADVREPEQVQAFVQACVDTYGRLDIAFNNAGIFMTPGELQDIEVDNYLDIMLTNAGGEFFAMKYEIPIMRAQGRGVIVNMASVAAFKGFPNTAAYNASKHAIIGMTKAAAIANAPHNIRVVSISPLAVDTPQLRESFAYQQVDPAMAASTFVTPRIMSTDEMANAVMFLADPISATAITGMNLDVTGGQLA
jgi:NAD(P)-dependent dehydrogenase (short-subunit alcohol dehydrogenase family)